MKYYKVGWYRLMIILLWSWALGIDVWGDNVFTISWLIISYINNNISIVMFYSSIIKDLNRV